MHNVFKIDQQPFSKLFITSQQTFIYSKSTRETVEIDVVLMSYSEYNSRHFLVFLILTLNRRMLLGIASSDYDNYWNF